MYKSEYVQTCREMEMIEERIADLPEGCVYPEKRKHGVSYYHQWYVGGKRQRKYVKKADVNTMKEKIERRKRLEEEKERLESVKEYYHQCLVDAGYNPEQLWREDQAKREELRQHRKQRKEAIDSDPYHNNVYVTIKNEFVRSRAEEILGNLLYMNGIEYVYEKLQEIGGTKIKPDFTIYYKGHTIYWEHAGLMKNTKYRDNWEQKKQAYARANIVEGKNLIVTYEHDGIDSVEIQYLIDKYILSLEFQN